MHDCSERVVAALLFVFLLCVYNANGREISSYDSQPTKFAARELLLRGTLSLNHVVGATPELLKRHSFVLARDGHYRSAYSPVPAVVAAAVVWPLARTGAIDLRRPLAEARIAVIAASTLTALAVVLSYRSARRFTSRSAALLVALGLGLGTGWWSTVSQTLWQHETAVFGLAVAVYALTADLFTWRQGLLLGLGLGLACASRLQLLPTAVLLLLAGGYRGGPLFMAGAAIPWTVMVGALLLFNLRTFGHVMGTVPMLEALHAEVHFTYGSFALGWEGYAGQLFSPNRGLLVFSPVVAVSVLSAREAARGSWQSSLRWYLLAACAQFALYGAYSVWWGGHTYGPRYMLDILPLLVVPAAVGMQHVSASRPARVLAAAALAWSVLVAAAGAFVYPAERWNTDPADVDRNHERLWDWRDQQALRALRTPSNERNFMLFGRK